MKKILKLFLVMSLSVAIPNFLYATSKVKISFDEFHGYNETVNYLKAVNKAYPSITKLLEIGKSTQNKVIYMLVITNQKSGTTLDREKKLVYERKLEVPNPPITDLDLGKPGFLLLGALHGDEKTGTEVCLYFIDQMLSKYNEDSSVTKDIDTKVFYVCPMVNTYGTHKTLGEEKIDIDRNFPEGWFVGDIMPDEAKNYNDRISGYRGEMHPAGEGKFPTSIPESHAICEFIVDHPNIIFANDYNGTGGNVYRPMGVKGDYRMEKRDITVYDEIMAPKYKELCGCQKWESASESGTEQHGLLIDWLYKQQGIYSLSIQPCNDKEENTKTLLSTCEKQFQFCSFCIGLMPQIKIDNVKVSKKEGYGMVVLNISAEVENAGVLPTTLKNAQFMPMNRGDVVWLVSKNNQLIFLSGNPCQKVGALDGTQIINGSTCDNHKKEVNWQVTLKSKDTIKIVASSLKGGTTAKEVRY